MEATIMGLYRVSGLGFRVKGLGLGFALTPKP